jgi:hypothetical protein
MLGMLSGLSCIVKSFAVGILSMNNLSFLQRLMGVQAQ